MTADNLCGIRQLTIFNTQSLNGLQDQISSTSHTIMAPELNQVVLMTIYGEVVMDNIQPAFFV
jgi:hypothetical protein